MEVKICGLTRIEETHFLNEYKPDYVGIVMFFPKSRRNMSIDSAKEIIAAVSPDIKKVAVTVSPTKEQLDIISKLGFDIIQIHGIVDDDLIAGAGLPVWKAFNVTDMNMLPHYMGLDNICGYVFDAGEPGSGKTFDWNSLRDIRRDGRKIILAGGLKSDNVAFAIKTVVPDVVDVSSGVEYDDKPGKDEDKVRSFIRNAKEACR